MDFNPARFAAASIANTTVSTESLSRRLQGGKAEQGAVEFEALLVGQLMEKLQETFTSEGETSDAAHDTVSSLGTQAIARKLAQNHAFGISNMLLRALTPTQPGPDSGKEGAKSVTPKG